MRRMDLRWKQVVPGLLLVMLWLVPLKMVFAQDAESAIRKVLDDQVSAWNRGDIDAFMQGYQNSPETTFIGKTIHHGWQEVLERYKQDYSRKEAEGRSSFRI